MHTEDIVRSPDLVAADAQWRGYSLEDAAFRVYQPHRPAQRRSLDTVFVAKRVA